MNLQGEKLLRKIALTGNWWTFVIWVLMISSAGAGQSPVHIPSLNATVVELVFYESARDQPPMGDRVYRTEFGQSQVRYICWELRMEHPNPGRKVSFRIEAKYYNPNGTLLTEHYIDSYFDTGWSNSNHSSGYGFDKPGNWVPGTYRVDIYIAGDMVASGTFEVVSDRGVYPPPEKPANRVYPPPEKPDKHNDIPDDLGDL